MKILIVGCGFSGAVIARELAEAGIQVVVIDKRDHIGGNCYDYIDNDTGIRVHKYGPHIFHTSNERVVSWLSRFTKWNKYEHKVRAMLPDGTTVPMPPNKETLEKIGKENILDVLFKPYTKKMWGVELEDLNPDIINRVPIREDDNDLYFPKDKYQLMPVDGYTAIFEKILDHEKITIRLATKFDKLMESDYGHVFNSMPIDEYFDYIYGELPYRSIKFHNFTLPSPSILELPTINFTNDGPFTRVTEWKKYPAHGENIYQTVITYEEPLDYRLNDYERYYPIKDVDGINRALYKKYAALTPNNMSFIGRCGQYIYIDMHQAVSSSLKIARNFVKKIK